MAPRGKTLMMVQSRVEAGQSEKRVDLAEVDAVNTRYGTELQVPRWTR